MAANRAFIFPGQGSQAVGMGRGLASAFASAREVFAAVDEALGEKLSALIFDGDQEELTLTANTQPALMAVSMAAVAALRAEFGINVDKEASLVAGHSLGEYSALAAAGVFSLSDAAALLRTRGNAMQKAVPAGVGCMAVLMGLEWVDVREICQEAASGDICVPANDNAPGQIVISGHMSAITRALALAKEHGAKRSMKLPVSAPFHCPLMRPAADAMRAALSSVDMHAPSVPVVSNVTAAETTQVGAIREHLVEQVCGSVRWRESVQNMAASGITEFVEIGAGKVLTGLVKRCVEDADAYALGEPKDLEEFAKKCSV
ncbi:malonyl CoA-acyl carrier protein transacylase [Alphaproteobacteria bacterium]|nr:malonyl CoA-acyl carrier protein transacylase [Alphaproteobacteria bacterium]